MIKEKREKIVTSMCSFHLSLSVRWKDILCVILLVVYIFFFRVTSVVRLFKVLFFFVPPVCGNIQWTHQDQIWSWTHARFINEALAWTPNLTLDIWCSQVTVSYITIFTVSQLLWEPKLCFVLDLAAETKWKCFFSHWELDISWARGFPTFCRLQSIDIEDSLNILYVL